jgi:glutathione peroxidase-family protein
VWAGHELAQKLGQKLGQRLVLQRPLPGQQTQDRQHRPGQRQLMTRHLILVLGFPSNDFSQEGGSNKQIADFCESTFGVKFPMFTKTQVTGEAAAPLFKQLTAQTGQKPRWNFHKYLIGRDGKVIDQYSSMTSPESKTLVSAIEKSLKAQP